jgi:hypothetical protein
VFSEYSGHPKSKPQKQANFWPDINCPIYISTTNYTTITYSAKFMSVVAGLNERRKDSLHFSDAVAYMLEEATALK